MVVVDDVPLKLLLAVLHRVVQGRDAPHVERGKRVAGALEVGQRRVARQVERGEPGPVAVQVRELGVGPHVERGERVGVAVQVGKLGVARQVEGGKPAPAAAQGLERGVARHVELPQVVVGLNVQGAQRRVARQVQGAQVVVVAVELLEGGEVLHALQAGDALLDAVNLAHRGYFGFAQFAVPIGVEVCRHVGTEDGVGEVLRVDRDVRVNFEHRRKNGRVLQHERIGCAGAYDIAAEEPVFEKVAVFRRGRGRHLRTDFIVATTLDGAPVGVVRPQEKTGIAALDLHHPRAAAFLEVEAIELIEDDEFQIAIALWRCYLAFVESCGRTVSPACHAQVDIGGVNFGGSARKPIEPLVEDLGRTRRGRLKRQTDLSKAVRVQPRGIAGTRGVAGQEFTVQPQRFRRWAPSAFILREDGRQIAVFPERERIGIVGRHEEAIFFPSLEMPPVLRLGLHRHRCQGFAGKYARIVGLGKRTALVAVGYKPPIGVFGLHLHAVGWCRALLGVRTCGHRAHRHK